MVGGGAFVLVNESVDRALRHLGYDAEQIEAIKAHIRETGGVVGAPGLDPAHSSVFACAVGDNFIEPMGHVRMLAALQPFLSGAASKTINLPADATKDDIKEVYVEAWRSGVKAVAVYRDGSKQGQPLSVANGEKRRSRRRFRTAGSF